MRPAGCWVGQRDRRCCLSLPDEGLNLTIPRAWLPLLPVRAHRGGDKPSGVAAWLVLRFLRWKVKAKVTQIYITAMLVRTVCTKPQNLFTISRTTGQPRRNSEKNAVGFESTRMFLRISTQDHPSLAEFEPVLRESEAEGLGWAASGSANAPLKPQLARSSAKARARPIWRMATSPK